jgi:hypothetical protein
MEFYTVKPLFLGLCRSVASFVGPERAVNLVAVAFYFLTGVLVWIWAERRTILTLLLVASFVVLDAGRNGTPDTMQAFFLVLGAWQIKKTRWYWVPLLLAVWVRADAAILGCLLIAVESFRKRSIPWAIVPLAASALWLELGYRHLIEFTTHGSFSSAIRATFTNSAITLLFPYVLLGCFAWKKGNRDLIAASGMAYAFHLILFPNPETRYALAPLLIIGAQALNSIGRGDVPHARGQLLLNLGSSLSGTPSVN